MFPSFILDKIYWYRWILSQKDICKEYYAKITFHDDGCYISYHNRHSYYHSRALMDRISICKSVAYIDCPTNQIVNFINHRFSGNFLHNNYFYSNIHI